MTKQGDQDKLKRADGSRPMGVWLTTLLIALLGLTGCGGDSSSSPNASSNTSGKSSDADAGKSGGTAEGESNADTDADDDVFWEAGPDETMIEAQVVPEYPRAGQPVELRITVGNAYGKLDALVSYRVSGRPVNDELTEIPPTPPWQPTRCTEEYMLDDASGEMVPLDASYNPRVETPVDRVFTATTALPRGFNHIELLVRYPNFSGDRRLDTPPSYLQGWTIDIP